MALTRQISRIAKLLVDAEGISFSEAEARLRSMTLEIVMGPWGNSPAGHAAALTALSVGRRSFLGGVRVNGDLDVPLRSTLSRRVTLGEALSELGTTPFIGSPAATIVIGGNPVSRGIAAWWDGWHAGVRLDHMSMPGDGGNPLAGIAAGALAVGAAFQSLRGSQTPIADLDLWPGATPAPSFGETYLPAALWLMGLGNLGQAFLWSLGALPFQRPADLMLFLQDFDPVGDENWATSVLVPDDQIGGLKTKLAEAWADKRGFTVRRIDRPLLAGQQLAAGEPRLCLSGLDKIAARRLLVDVGFDAVVDAGLGRTAQDFDKYRVNVFDAAHRIDDHFAEMEDVAKSPHVPDGEAYRQLEADIGRCGAAEIGHASIAVPYVSAIAGATAIARVLALCSGLACVGSEVHRVSLQKRRSVMLPDVFETRGIGHSGQPRKL